MSFSTQERRKQQYQQRRLLGEYRPTKLITDPRRRRITIDITRASHLFERVGHGAREAAEDGRAAVELETFSLKRVGAATRDGVALAHGHIQAVLIKRDRACQKARQRCGHSAGGGRERVRRPEFEPTDRVPLAPPGGRISARPDGRFQRYQRSNNNEGNDTKQQTTPPQATATRTTTTTTAGVLR